MGDNASDYLLGLALAVTSTVFIGSSFLFKKLGLLRLRKTSSLPASEGGCGYLQDWVWWVGFLTLAVGEIVNFAAYAFAPASLVTPLGALSILIATVLASKFLDERLGLLSKLGCVLCILGSTIVVIHAPKDGEVHTLDELYVKIRESGFLFYVLIIVVIAIFLSRYAVPRYGQTNPGVYVFICASIGSLSVMLCKGLGLGLRETLAGKKFLFDGSFFVFLIPLAICLTVQMIYLNMALDTFDTSIVNPLNYICFTSFVIIASSILFEEWRNILFIDIVATLVGLGVVVIGLFMMNVLKNLQISWAELNVTARKNKGNTYGPIQSC